MTKAVRLLVFTAEDPATDLALEEAIHLHVESGKSVSTWRLWQPRRTAVILGAGLHAAREANLPRTAENAVPVLRRHTGGGAVVVGPGTLNYSAFYRFEDLPGAGSIRGATSAALQPMIGVLAGFGIQSREAGLSDLVVESAGVVKKIAGHSQARKRASVLVHGTLLADPVWEDIDSLLPMPSRMPDYREGRTHGQFLVSARDLGASIGLDSLAAAMGEILPSVQVTEFPTEDEWRTARELLREKYSADSWNLRR